MMIEWVMTKSACRNIRRNMNRRTFHRSGYYLIVLSECITMQMIGNIFRECRAEHMPNVNVLVPRIGDNESSAILYTYYPYTATHCDHADPVVVQRFDRNTFTNNAQYFPDKFANMFKCNLYGLMSHLRPYVIYENTANGEMSLAGFAINLMRGVADNLNFTFVNHPNTHEHNTREASNISINLVRKQYWVDSYSMNELETSIYCQMKNGLVNMTIDSLTMSGSKSNAFTHPFFMMPVTIVSPIGMPYSSLERIAMPFSNLVWLCTLIATIFIVQYFYLCRGLNGMNDIRRNDDYIFVVFEAINLTLSGSLPARTLRAFKRSGLTVWLLATLILRNIYSCTLFDLLQAQINERPVDTVERLIESNYEIYCSPTTYDVIYQYIPVLRKQ